MPPAKPLAANDPWVKITMKFFGCDEATAMQYGGQLRNNMYQWLQSQIKQDDERRKRQEQINKDLRGY